MGDKNETVKRLAIWFSMGATTQSALVKLSVDEIEELSIDIHQFGANQFNKGFAEAMKAFPKVP